LILQLSPNIFPERSLQNILTGRDQSDLRHIATAIHHHAAGFITSEKAILRARAYLNEVWKIDVVGIEEFAHLVTPNAEDARDAIAEVPTGMLRVRRNERKDMEQAPLFFRNIGVSPTFVESALACHDDQVRFLAAIDERQRMTGFAAWTVYGGTRRMADICLVVDETSCLSDVILDYIFDTIPRELSAPGPTFVRFNIPACQIATRQAALASGFRVPAGERDGNWTLQRLVAGRVMRSQNWLAVRQSLLSAGSLSLPKDIPSYEAAIKKIYLNTGRREIAIPLPALEQALSPTLLLLPGRDGVIVPIKEHFCRDLFGASPQLSLLAPPEAILRRERVYISAPRTLKRLKPGSLIVFYESLKGNGRGCAIAIARITGSRVVAKADALDTVARRGVLNHRSLENRSVTQEVTETSFDNIFVFRNPVPLERLRKLGCVDGANLVTAKAISFKALTRIVEEGQVDG